MPEPSEEYKRICAGIAALEEQRSACEIRIKSIDSDATALDEKYSSEKATLAADRLQARQEREKISGQLSHFVKLRDAQAVQEQVQDNLAASAAARLEAEKQTADLAEKNRQADELLAKLDKQLEAAASPVG